MKVKLVLPSLEEAGSPLWRPIKYALFPPLGLATLAAYLNENDAIELQDLHVEKLNLNDDPDLVIIQVYITNSKRAYDIASHYKMRGAYILLGGLHVSALPDEAAKFADTIFIGPGEQSFPQFLLDFKKGNPRKRYISTSGRTLLDQPPPRRDLIKRDKYLVPNSIVISRGCPHHCDFCYKDDFFKGGRSFYTQRIDAVLKEIESLPGRHLYFLDDHLFGYPKFVKALFKEMEGMGRVFQGAATVSSILDGDLIHAASKAGLRSLFVGFETLSSINLKFSNKKQNLNRNYDTAIKLLHELGLMINGSFVFGLDDDGPDVFKRTVDWGVKNALTTATYHVLTPYPGTRLYEQMNKENRIIHKNWELYDTRHAVYQPKKLTPKQLEEGYKSAYAMFYSWSNIVRASMIHESLHHKLKHFFYTGGWKKFENLWGMIINAGGLKYMLPLLELLLSDLKHNNQEHKKEVTFMNIHEFNKSEMLDNIKSV